MLKHNTAVHTGQLSSSGCTNGSSSVEEEVCSRSFLITKLTAISRNSTSLIREFDLFLTKCYCCQIAIDIILQYEGDRSRADMKELHHPKCEVCHQFIPTNGAGLIVYRCHPYWKQKYCPSHEHDGTARCCSCERLESWNRRHTSLGDGRSLCLECMESAITDNGDCQSLYHAIRDYYEGLYIKLDQQIPMLLVDRQALNEAIEGQQNGYQYHHTPETRGICLWEEKIVTSVSRNHIIFLVNAVCRLLTGSILAHELMHGWLRLKGYRNLSPEVEEGICQVLSYMWLESKVLPGSRNMATTASSSSSSSKKGEKFEKKLGEFFMHLIAHDTSTAYGGGFRAGNAAVNRYGLRRTLDHIRLTGNFPM
ncbi:hypothetical protein MKW92_030146 [Papaver armeniacum]|nr:hypothetical protein MKW92_030146 [Papaver armeniacum]